MTPTENIPWSIEVASGTVYWIEQDSTHHALHAEPTGGGGVMNLYSTSSSDPTAPEDNLAVDATGIYYGSFNDIIRIGPGGGSTFVLSQNNPWPQGMAIDASNVYWATQGQCPFPYDGGTCQTGFVYQVSQGGGTVFTLSSGERAPASVAVMGGMVYWMSDGAGDGTASAVVRSAPIGGGPVRTIASGFVADYNHDGNNPCSTCLAVDATSVYFTTYDGTSTSAVMKVPLTGGVATTLASSFGDVNSLALDSSGLYIADQQQGSIVQVPVGGGAPVVVVAAGTNAPMTPWNIALDANDVYYTAFQCPGGGGECSGQVFRVAKP
jgi:hypothetical protein